MVLARHRSDARPPGGEPLQRVKGTFVDEAMARREMRPLLDAGVEVWCYAPDATLMRVADQVMSSVSGRSVRLNRQ